MLKSKKFTTRLFLYYSITVTLVIVAAFLLFYLYILHSFESQYVGNIRQITVKTMDQMDSVLTEMDRVALYIVANPAIVNTYSGIGAVGDQHDYFDDNPDKKSEVVNNLLAVNLPASSPTGRVSLYNRAGNYISIGGFPETNAVVQSRVRSADYVRWYDSISANKQGATVLPPHDDFWSDSESPKMISLVRNITNLYRSCGVVEVQESYDDIEKIFNIQGIPAGNIYLVEKNGTLINTAGGQHDVEVAGYFLKKAEKEGDGYFKAQDPSTHKTDMVFYASSSFTDWTLLIVQPERSAFAFLGQIGSFVILAGTVLLGTTLLLFLLISRRLTKPLVQLKNSLKVVDIHNMHLELAAADDSDEITQLNTAFKTMFERLKNSMEQLVRLHEQESKAQLLALQSQMDPHFLHNTLSVISAVGQEAGSSRVMELCCRLSNMLQYTASFASGNVTIGDELVHTRNYLELMNERYEDHFSYSIETDDSLLGVAVPKLLFQPLVENAFQHGFKSVRPPWNIAIVLGRAGDGWLFQVRDNGGGISDDNREKILANLAQFTCDPSETLARLKLGGLGLLNIYARLRLVYGDDLLFRIEHNTPRGAVITIGGKCHDPGHAG